MKINDLEFKGPPPAPGGRRGAPGRSRKSRRWRREAAWWVPGALTLVQVFFGLHYLAAKVLLETIPPRAWALVRVAAAGAVLSLTARASGRRLRLPPQDLGRLALFAVFGVVVNQVCFVEGLHRTTPSHASIIMTSIPVSTLLFAVLLRRERLSWLKAASLGVSFAGVMMVLRPSGVPWTDRTFVGDLLTLVNALSYGFFLVISKRLFTRIDPLVGTAWLFVFGSAGIAAVGLPAALTFDWTSVPPSVWGLAAIIIAFPTALAYFLNSWALARVESSSVALFIYLQPVLATALSAWLLEERPGLNVLAGGALVCTGVYRPPAGASRKADAPPLEGGKGRA